MSSSSELRLLKPQPFQGDRVSIVIGIDVGTTFSGVSYAILRPGEVPKIQPVTRFSDQDNGDSKLPSVIYYDEDMKPAAIGAACTKDTVIEDAEERGWVKVEHFKMHLRPSSMKLETNGLEMKPLPDGTSAEDVMADFLRYLFDETGKYITDFHTDGPNVWPEVRDRANFVLAHPNGWTGPSQQKMRRSAIRAGLVPNISESLMRISFVTEGEASALACLSGGLGPECLEPGFRFMVLDAGGGSLDVDSYEVTKVNPVELKELARPDCRFAGSVFVNMAAREVMERKLHNSRFDEPLLLDDAVNYFDQFTKRQFDSDSDSGLVRIGDRRASDPKLGVRGGYLKLTREQLQETYEFSVREAVDSIREQVKECGNILMPVWLVGGFAASPWLASQLQFVLEPEGIRVLRPDTNVSKAVANGTILYYLDRSVTTRVSKVSYGIPCCTIFNSQDPEHQKRSHLTYVKPLSGERVLDGRFDCIIERGISVEESKTFSRAYFLETITKGALSRCNVNLHSYDGDLPVPYWYTDNKDKIRKSCNLSADLSELFSGQHIISSTGKSYLQAHFSVELQFGTTELQAKITWTGKDGSKRQGPVQILYEE